MPAILRLLSRSMAVCSMAVAACASPSMRIAVVGSSCRLLESCLLSMDVCLACLDCCLQHGIIILGRCMRRLCAMAKVFCPVLLPDAVFISSLEIDISRGML